MQIIIFNFCLRVHVRLCVHMCMPNMYVLVLWMSAEDTGFPGAGDTVVNCLVWALGTSLGPEKEQYMLLTAEPPLRLCK